MKNTIFGIVIGIVIAIVGYLGWSFYQLNSIVSQDHAVLAQIIAMIQSSQKQAATPAK